MNCSVIFPQQLGSKYLQCVHVNQFQILWPCHKVTRKFKKSCLVDGSWQINWVKKRGKTAKRRENVVSISKVQFMGIHCNLSFNLPHPELLLLPTQGDLRYTANVYRSLRGVCRFSLQYLWKKAIRITEKPFTHQRERL